MNIDAVQAQGNAAAKEMVIGTTVDADRYLVVAPVAEIDASAAHGDICSYGVFLHNDQYK